MEVRAEATLHAWLIGLSFEAGPPEISLYAGPFSMDLMVRERRRGDRAWPWCWTLFERSRFSLDLDTQYWVLGASWGRGAVHLFWGPLNLTLRHSR